MAATRVVMPLALDAEVEDGNLIISGRDINWLPLELELREFAPQLITTISAAAGKLRTMQGRSQSALQTTGYRLRADGQAGEVALQLLIAPDQGPTFALPRERLRELGEELLAFAPATQRGKP
jgi:hypothetical protein